MLKDGKAVTPSTKLPSEAVSQGYSFLGVLQNVGALERLKPWFEGVEKSPFKEGSSRWQLSSDIAEYLGFQAPETNADYVNFTSNVPLSVDLTGAKRIVGPLQAFQDYKPEVAKEPMTAFYDATTLTIRLETTIYKVPLKALLEKTKARLSTDTGKQPAISFEIAPGVIIAIDSIYGNLNDTPPLGSARFWLILQQ
jgi:hypothetical protein